jgi:hypothetical protein
VRGKAVPQGVTGGLLVDVGRQHGLFDRSLQVLFVDVVAANLAVAFVQRAFRCR